MQNLSLYTNEYLPTEDHVRNFINARPAVIRPVPTAYLLNQDMTPKDLPNPKNKLRPNDMSNFVLGSKIANNTSQDIHRSCDLSLLEVPGIEQFDNLVDYVQLGMRYVDRRREKTILEVPIGIFGFDITDRDLSPSGNSWSVKGYDLTREVAACGFLDLYTIPAGYKVTDVVKALLMECSLPPVLPDGTTPPTARQPSGVAWAQPFATQSIPSLNTPPPVVGDPYNFGPHGMYSPNGVRVEDIGTAQTLSGTGQPVYVLPNGDTYPHFSGARVDPTTYEPIDPWTGQVMTPLAGTPMWYVTSNHLQFDTLSSVIYQPFSGGTMPVPWDPFRWINSRTQYQFWDQANNRYTGSELPLFTWPFDFDGSGPYYQSPATNTQNAVTTVPTVSATGTAWPDVNNPGLTPAGCPDVGPNIPAHRVAIDDSPVTIPYPIPLTRKTNRLTAVNNLLKAINYWPLWVDEHGVFRSSPMPYYYNFVPGAGWTYTTSEITEAGLKRNGTIKPPVKVSIADQTALYTRGSGCLREERRRSARLDAVQHESQFRHLCPAPG
jgi:hypothetical protein